MAELSRSEKFRKISVDDIEHTYRMGHITAYEKNQLLREKGHAELDGLLEEKGYLKGIFEQSIRNIQKGWDNVKEAIVRHPTEGTIDERIKGEAYYAGLAVWGQLQMLTSISSAVGEVTGQKMEQLALRAGASPGLARAINLATDVGMQFVPVGTVAKSTAKTVQDVAGKVANAASVAPKVDEAAVRATKIVADGLKMDGVKAAHTVMGKSAESAGQPIKEAIEAAGREIPNPSEPVRESFLRSLNTFKAKMDRITKVQAHEETAAMAQKLGLTLEDLRRVVPGTALDEKQMYAYLKALEPEVTKLQDLAKTVQATGTPESVEALARHASELFTIAPIFRASEVTAGRSVEILKTTPPMKQLTDLMNTWDPASMAKGDFHGAMKTFADDLVAIADKPEQVTKLALQGQMGGPELWPKMREIYINMLLSRPLTQVRNTIGNSIAATNGILERYAGGMFSANREAGVHWNEGTYLAKGMMHGIGDGLKAFGEAYKKVDPSDANKFDYVPHQIGGTIGRIINLPGDTMRGMDNFFKTILTRGNYYAQAMREGAQAGKTGNDLAEHVARRLSFPTKAMIEEGEQFALSSTFQNELGTLGRMSTKLQTGPLALWFPFMKTPINLAKYTWNRTPGLQLLSRSLYDDILAGGVKADMAIGRLTISNLTGMYLYNLAQEGLITGSGPIDPKLRPAWLANHQPYSLKTSEGWVPISNIEPGSTFVGIAADYAQVMNQLDEPTVGQGAMAVGFSVMKNLADKTFWPTVSDIVDLASGIKHGQEGTDKMRRMLDRPLITISTGGPLVSTTTKIIDPIMRESRSLMDDWMSKAPGYSKNLPAVKDAYGDPVLVPQTVGSEYLAYISPLQYAPGTKDPVKLEGDKLKARIDKFPWSVGGTVTGDLSLKDPQPGERVGVQLTPQQRDRWQNNYKSLLRGSELGIESKLLQDSRYQQSPNPMKREMFEGYISDLKSTAFDQLLMQDRGLHKKILQSDANTLRPMLNEEQQGQLEEQVQHGLGLIDKLSTEERQNLFRFGDMTPDEPTVEAIP